jgi:HAD superfamily hydrolase (TIGR01509 family)
MDVKAVILDVDGTLIDSNDAHAQAWVDVGKEFGYEITFERVRSLIGMGGDHVLPELTGLEEESEQGKRILDRRGEIFRKRYLPSLAPFPYARELLERIDSDGYRMIVASSASKDDLHGLLEQAGVADLLDGATSSDDAEKSKPAPDIVEAALERAGCAPDEALMIGDTPYDVKAATHAGVRTLALRCGGWDDEHLAGAVQIFDAPAELFLRYTDSVLGEVGKKLY